MQALRNRRPSRARRFLLRLIRWLGRPNLIILTVLLTLLVVALGALALSLIEGAFGGEPDLASWSNAFWYMLSQVVRVSVGARTPSTEAGRSVAIIGGVLGLALSGFFTAAIASALVNRLILEDKGLGEYNLKNHIVIGGWNNHVRQMVNVLSQQALGRGVAVVLLADLPENPVPKTTVRFLRGDPTLDSDLERASVKDALSVIILADESHGMHDDATTDARTVLTALAVESVNPNVYTIAEVRDPSNRRHFARTKCDEIVASSELAGGLLARTALNPGVGQAIATLMRLDESAEMYVIPAPAGWVGKSFDEAMKVLREQYEAILVGLAHRGSVMLSPKGDRVLAEGDKLVMIAHQWPTGLA